MRPELRFGLALSVLLALGCSGSGVGNPVEPENLKGPDTVAPQQNSAAAGNRYLWGMWAVRISEDHQSGEVVPLRATEMHLNALRMLQETPCSDCLTISNIEPTCPNELSVDVTLRHPFPGRPKLTGFDVRGIFISGADYTFPESGRIISWGDDLPRMLNADGFTTLFNPTEFPMTNPPALGYIRGHYATGGDLSATLNPFLAYAQDAPRRLFEAGRTETRTFTLYAPPGPIRFGYAVDVCWQLVDGEVTDPVTDFPPDANCLEAYQIRVLVRQGLGPYVGASAKLEVEIYDHQGTGTVESVIVEAPDLMPGAFQLVDSTVIGEDSCLFVGDIANELGAGLGDYPLLVRVVDIQEDQNLGAIDAWQLISVGVKEGWARTWGGRGTDKGYGVAVDDSGDIYVTGCFSSIVDFDPGPGIEENVSNGSWDAFLSKFDPSGDFLWCCTWGGEDGDYGTGIAIDGSGNIYATGEFEETADFDPGPGTDEHISNGKDDAFLSKFDSGGEFQWARTWGGADNDSGKAVVADLFGNVYVTGSFSKTVDFDPGPGTEERTSNGGTDVFLSKFDSTGHLQWAHTWGGVKRPWFPGDYSGDVTFDGVESIYVTGGFTDKTDFDPGPGVEERIAPMNSLDAFLSKFNMDGEFQWVRTWGGIARDSGRGVSTDINGNVYVTGSFGLTVDFDPGPGIEEHTSGGYGSGYLSRFDSSGEFHWVSTLISNENGPCFCFEVATGESGSACVTGRFNGTVDFDPGPGIEERTSEGYGSVFVSTFNSDGEFQWASTWGGEGMDEGWGVAVDEAGNVYVTGDFQRTVDFDPGPSVEYHSSNGGSDAFLCRLLPDGSW